MDDTIKVNYHLVILKPDWGAWVVLTEGKDVGLLCKTGLWETIDASDS